jgi:hypothetical protein
MKSLLRLRVIAPSAPKYTRHGYNGSGYIGIVESESDTHATVRFGINGIRRFHKSHLSILGQFKNDKYTA